MPDIFLGLYGPLEQARGAYHGRELLTLNPPIAAIEGLWAGAMEIQDDYDRAWMDEVREYKEKLEAGPRKDKVTEAMEGVEWLARTKYVPTEPPAGN